MASLGKSDNAKTRSLRDICLENIGSSSIEYYDEDYLEHVPLQCLEGLVKYLSPVHMERLGSFFEKKCDVDSNSNDYWFKAVCRLQREFSVNYISLDRSAEFEYEKKRECYKDMYFQLLYNQFMYHITCERNQKRNKNESMLSLMRKVATETRYAKYIKKLHINPKQCKYICSNAWLLNNVCSRVSEITLSHVSNEDFEQVRNILAATVFYGKVKKVSILKCDINTLSKENCTQLWDICRGEYYGTHPLKQERLQHATPENRSEIYRHYDHSTELTDRNKEDIYDCVFESTRPQCKSNESSAKNFWDSNPIQVHTCDGIDKLTIGETVARPSPILHSEVSKSGSIFHALVKRDDHASHNSEFFRTLHHICPKLMNLRHLTIRDFLVNDSFNDVCDVINDAITRTRVTSLDTLLQLPISMILQKYSDPSLGENVSLPVNARLASQKPTLLTHLCVKLNLNGVIPTVLYTIDSKGDITVDTYNLKSLSTYAYIDIGAYGRSKCTNFKVVCALIKHSSNLKVLSLSGCRWIEIMELTSLINHTTLPNLTAVTLDSFDLKWVHVLRIVEYNPSLESLTLRDCSLSRFAQNEFEDLSEKIGEHANLSYLDISNNPLGGSVLKLFLAIIEFRIANHAAFFKFVKFSHNGINTEDAWTLAKGMKKLSDKLHGKLLMDYLNLNHNLVKHAEIDKLIEEFGNSVGFLDIRTQIKGAMAEFVAQM